jgi:hypothetical protein
MRRKSPPGGATAAALSRIIRVLSSLSLTLCVSCPSSLGAV